MPTTEEIRALLHRSAALRRALNDLASEMTATSTAMIDRGVPPSEEFAQAVGAARRAFITLRGDTMTVASAIGLQMPEHLIDS